MEKIEQSYNMTYSQMAELQNLNKRLGELSAMIPEMCQENISKLSLGFNLGRLNGFLNNLQQELYELESDIVSGENRNKYD
jgi:flagellar biosynthesis chaperone FliJ